jgi:hypothetical protein
MSISFVIRLKNNEFYIGHCIQSILDHFNNPEIIILNNNCIDEGIEIVNLFPKAAYNINTIDIDKYKPGIALNVGVNIASNDIVGIISAHCEIISGSLDVICNHFKQKNCFGVFGEQIPRYKGKFVNRRYIWDNFITNGEIIKNPIEKIPEQRYFFHNAFSFISKKHWQEERFSEILSGKEDRHYANQQIFKGNYCLLDPSLKCYHHFANNATWQGIG